ncbi:MAG: acriflavine resistance protein B [Blastopirellula sp.]|nr:MAG: acriflavine resistance protein B [Blastopirellula sp.]
MSNLFYRNTRLLVLSVVMIVVAGMSSFFVLPRLEDPELTPRFAIVTTRFPGATAERVESLVTEKLEEELQEIDELKEVQSVSRAGSSTLVLELDDTVYQVAEVWSRIRDKLDDARNQFPAGVLKPDIDEITTKSYAVITALKWTQDDRPNYAILRRKTQQLEDRLRAVTGTEDVDVFGDPEEEIAVELRPAELAARGLTAADVARQLAASDAKVAAGQLRSTYGDFLLEVGGEFDSIDRIAQTPIQFGSEGQVVRLSDVADVRKGISQPPRSLSVVEGTDAIVLGALVDSKVRIDLWARDVDKILTQFESELPRGVELTRIYEQSKYVEARLGTLMGNLAVGGLAIVVVILLMMGWRSALIVSVALPLSTLMVLTGLRLLEVPLHQMSITGLILALGLLIDNAIVIVDEVQVRLRAGVTRAAAVSDSVRHLSIPLLGSTVTTALAFSPLALMPGPAGEFVGTIATSVILAIFSSLLLALTVIPALSALASQIEGRAQHWWQSGYTNDHMTAVYRAVLVQLFRRPWWGMALAVVLPVFGFIQARHLPEQFFPPADRNQIHVEIELPAHGSIQATKQLTIQAREQLLANSRVKRVSWFLGESAPSFYYNIVKRREFAANYAQGLIELDSAEDIGPLIHQLQKELDELLPEARVLVRQLEQGPPFDAPIEVRVFGPDLETLRELSQQVREVLAAIPDVVHTRDNATETLPKLVLQVDEEEARLVGLDNQMIAEQLDALLEGVVGGSILEETEQLPVRVRVAGSQRANLSSLASLDLVLPLSGERVPLGSLAKIQFVPDSAAIPRHNNQRLSQVQAFTTAGVLPSIVLAEFKDNLAASGFELPPGYRLEYGGESAKRNDAVGNLMSSVGVLMVMMVATLVLSFSSFRMAALIGVVAILSVGLGLGSLWLFGFSFGFMAIVGTMGLVGVAINDAIVVAAAIRDDEQARAGDPEAIADVVVRSTRHVLATTVTTIVGFLPLVLSGGGFWPPMAVAIAGGVTGATILALCFVPSAYVLVMCRRCTAITVKKSIPIVMEHRESLAV